MSRRFDRLAHTLIAAVVLVLAAAGTAAESAEPTPIWIDTDAACGSSELANAGDCWALALALRSDRVVVRGISSVSGAIGSSEAAVRAVEVAKRFGFSGTVHRGGARKKYRPMAASRGLGAALKRERLTIVALGPLTNIAAVLVTQPKVASQIERVVTVFGTPPEITEADNLSDYRNYNAAADTKAVAALMRTAIDVVVIPIDIARGALLTGADIKSVGDGDASAQWLAGMSRGWLHIWRERIGEEGPIPAEAAAVAYLTHPDLLTCKKTQGRFAWRHSFFSEKSGLQIGDDVEEGRAITYCGAIKAEFRDRLIQAIAGAGS